MSPHRKALVALTSGVLALPVVATPALAAPGDTPVPAQQSIAAFCLNAPDAGFTDVAGSATFSEAIRCLAGAGISRGGPGSLSDDQYGPGLAVTRASMASFIARLLDAADERDRGDQVQDLPPAEDSAVPVPGDDGFRDVPEQNVHADAIARLAAAGIVQGGAGGGDADLYSPDAPVTRAQMATFINRAVAFSFGEDPAEAGETTGLVAEDADYYVDDEGDETHSPNINGITSAGIAVGSGDQRYSPSAVVSRGQMAAFLTRTLAELFDRSDVNTLLESLVITPRTTATVMPTTENPDDGNPVDDRTFTVTGLEQDVEYRLTLVQAANVARPTSGASNQVVFAVDSSAAATPRGNRLAAAGTADADSADITSVNGEAPQNNNGQGAELTDTTPGQTPSAVAVPDEDGAIEVTIDGDTAPEDVIVVVYVNGGPAGRSNAEGGESPRLELDAQGRPVEFFGISGRTEFRSLMS